jgi:N-acetylneuraminic acid mutarotase
MAIIKRNGFGIIFLLLSLCLMGNGEAASLSFNWKQLTPSQSPPARRFATMAFDPGREQIILFGGYNGHLLNDTWAYDAKANTWINLAPSQSPPARAGAAMALDQTTGLIILFGGYSGDHYQDTWGYDAKENKWLNLTSTSRSSSNPSARAFASMAFDPLANLIILFGGENGRELRDTWGYDAKIKTWSNLTPSAIPIDYPPARYGAAMVFDPGTNQLILVGGGNEEWSLNDTWSFDAKTQTWKRLKPKHSLPPLEFAASALDRSNGQLLLFGGSDTDAFYDVTWRYDPKANTWEQARVLGYSPSARYGASMAYDPISRQTILFGGDNKRYLGDTWALHAELLEKPMNMKK